MAPRVGCDGSDLLLVASNGGADRPPAWLLNLEANPAVEFQIGKQREAGTAAVVQPSGARHQRVSQIVNANNHDRYTGYQQQTARPIPVVAVTPT